MSGTPVPLSVHGETLLLHHERAVIWSRCRTIIVADTHFGKSGHFGRNGIAVPAGADQADRARLDRLITEVDASRLIILGDFVHAPLAVGSGDADDLQSWLERLAESVEVHVVAGNHDRGAQQSRRPPIRYWEEYWINPPFQFIHDAGRAAPTRLDPLFSLSGHVHPVMRLRGPGKATLRIPVFWQRATGLILPSFGSFTGGYAVAAAKGERMFGVGSTGVVPFRAPADSPT